MSEEQKSILQEEARSLGVRLARCQERRVAAERTYQEASSAATRAQTALRRAEEDLEVARAEEERTLGELQASALRRHVLLAKE